MTQQRRFLTKMWISQSSKRVYIHIYIIYVYILYIHLFIYTYIYSYIYIWFTHTHLHIHNGLSNKSGDLNHVIRMMRINHPRYHGIWPNGGWDGRGAVSIPLSMGDLQDPKKGATLVPYFGPYFVGKISPYIWNRYLQSIGSWNGDPVPNLVNGYIAIISNKNEPS